VTNSYSMVTVFQEVTTTTKSTPATGFPPGTPQVDTLQVSIAFTQVTSGGETTIHQVDAAQVTAQVPGQAPAIPRHVNQPSIRPGGGQPPGG